MGAYGPLLLALIMYNNVFNGYLTIKMLFGH